MAPKTQSLLGTAHISSAHHQYSPTNLGRLGLQSSHITPEISQTSSPMQSMLGTAHLASSSVTSRPSEGNITAVVSQSSVQPRLGGAQLAPSLQGSLNLQEQPSSLSFTPSLPMQERMSSSQLGLSWNTTAGQSSGYSLQMHTTSQPMNQDGNLGMLAGNQCGSQFVTGRMSAGIHMQESLHYQSQMQLNSMEYPVAQQHYSSYNQAQEFSQNPNNFQFNVNYIESCDPNLYDDYYYGDYQYSDSYSGSMENLDQSYLGIPAGQATTPYGDETVEDLGPEEVRWFYKVEADKKWTPFIGYDSLRIEWKFRDLLQDTTSGGYENSTYGSVAGSSLSPKEIQDGKSRVTERIVVRGGLYEVDVKQRKCESIYWQGEVFIISRGTWFYDGTWGPVEEQLADRIELEHLTHFRGHLLSSQRVDDSTKEVLHCLSLPEGEVDWFSASQVYLTSDATPSRLMRSVGKKLGFQKTGYKLNRGYSIDATSSDKPPDINHIVFVIHGIGQKMERGRIIKNTTALRENISFLKQKYFPNIVKTSNTVEFFPVEWRSSLVLDAGIIDSITPQKILNIRQMLNASFMDIMYYNSPLYREEIITGLTGEMNRLYTMFTQRNPYFEANGGKVSMVAHSLGCVITYDIVTGWNPAQEFDRQLVQSLIENMNKSSELQNVSQIMLKKSLQELLKQHESKSCQPSLNFKIENFFCLGSPLAVFLALRTKPSQDAVPDIIPQKLCKRLLNIFHPADPVAYRIEPLLCPEYSNIAPVLIHSYSATDKIPYNEMPLEPIIVSREKDYKDGLEKSRADSGGNTPVSSVPSTPVKGGTSSWSLWGLMKGSKKLTDTGSSTQDLIPSLQDVRSLSDRTDFVLREGSMENSYISAITSHTSYWTNYDVSHFLLSILYPDMQPTSSKLEGIKS